MSTRSLLTNTPTERHPVGVQALQVSGTTVVGSLPIDPQPRDCRLALIGPAVALRGESVLTDPLPAIPTRQIMRSGETRLVAAVLEDAAYRCARLAIFLASGAFEGGHVSPQALRAEAWETCAWITSDDESPWSMAWCCEVLTATSGVMWRTSAVRSRLLSVLNGGAQLPQRCGFPVLPRRRHRAEVAGPRGERRRSRIVQHAELAGA